MPEAAAELGGLWRFVEEHFSPDLELGTWRAMLASARWAFPSWPERHGGRGLPARYDAIVAAELASAYVPGPPEGVGTGLAAPTLLEHGSDELCDRLLGPTARGEVTWCQLFSEPQAGSDLAGLRTRAERDGDEWLVSGQKLWSTGAATADLGLLVARTNWDVPKHAGLTCFVLPMRAGGIEVRPLRQMNGHASFNEVFLDGARAPAANVVGEVGGGWKVALTTLSHERRLAPARRRQPEAGESAARRQFRVGRAWRESVAERTAASEPHRWYPQRAGRVDLLAGRAAATGTNGDRLVRQEVAAVIAMQRAAAWSAERAVAARRLGRPPGAEGSLGKLASSNIARAAASAHAHIAGMSGTLAGADAPLRGIVVEILVSVPAISIAGGTDEIQHNILGERVLGLDREPDASRGLPFREVPSAG